MPQKICTLCVHQANSAQYFILKCKETDRMLKQNLFVAKNSGASLQIGIIDFDVHDDDVGNKVCGIDPLRPDECEHISDLYEIEDVINENTEFSCDKCIKSYTSDDDLQRHRDDEHPTQNGAIDERFNLFCNFFL